MNDASEARGSAAGLHAHDTTRDAADAHLAAERLMPRRGGSRRLRLAMLVDGARPRRDYYITARDIARASRSRAHNVVKEGAKRRTGMPPSICRQRFDKASMEMTAQAVISRMTPHAIEVRARRVR